MKFFIKAASLFVFMVVLTFSACGGGGANDGTEAPDGLGDTGGSSTLNSDASLLSIEITSITFNPEFSPEVTSYTGSIPLSIEKIFVILNAGLTSSVAINGTEATSNVATEITMNLGVNVITILVTAEDGTENIYTLTITRGSTEQQAYIKAGDRDIVDYFGFDTAISGETIVVGSPSQNDETNQIGAVYVFVRNGSIWSQQACLKIAKDASSGEFGRSVAIDGDTIVVGKYHSLFSAVGEVYVFVRSGSTWTQQACLKIANDDAYYDLFGYDVAISGDTIVVGAPGEDSNAIGIDNDETNNSSRDSGAAYIFVRSGTTWSRQAFIKAGNTDAYDSFGFCVGISGDTVVVGAYAEDSNATGINGNGIDNSIADSGAAYVFVRSGSAWSQQAYVKPANNSVEGYFGYSVAIDGDTIVVGERQEDSIAYNSGAAYVFKRSGVTWSQQAFLKISDPLMYNYFGYSVAIDGDNIVVGAPYRYLYSGSMYVFERNDDTWAEQACLRASNAGQDDFFGLSVGISGNTYIAGANREDSNASGINGDGTNNSVQDSGAVYAFIRH